MTTANKITLTRIAMIPFFIYFAAQPMLIIDETRYLAAFPTSTVIALVLFCVASFTDFLDGYVARKYNQVTDFGKFVDPLADKLLVLAEQAGIPAVICLNKIDLAPAGLVAEIEAVYKRAGYEVYAISAQQGINVGKLKDRLYGKITVFAGPSGVGKSSTLNAIEPGMQLVTGSVSEKIGRGKHTTRFAHLLPFAGGYLADTPGFGNLNLEELDDKKLAACFREFAGFEEGCKFTPCTHTHEPICGVKDALAAGEIAQSRYESYLTILEEIKSKKEKDGRK